MWLKQLTMKNIFIPIILALFSFQNCTNNPNPFLISKQSVGLLNDSTTVGELKQVFPNDSLSRFIDGDEFLGHSNIIKVYDSTSQKLLLELTPSEALDSLSTIQNIRIMDEQFKTTKGLNIESNFEEISSKYTISSVQNTLRNLIVSVDEINAYFTIDKSELPEDLRYDMSKKIEALSIPPKAKIKDFFIQWY